MKTRRKQQPTAECYREQLALAADEIIRLRSVCQGAMFQTLTEAQRRSRAAGLIVDNDHPPPPAPPPCRSITAYPPGHSLWRRIFRKS